MSIKNITELQEFLQEQLARVAEGDLTPAAANASSNLAGKLMSAVKMESDHHKLMGTPPNIDFLNAVYTNKRPKLIEKKRAEYNRLTGEV